MDEYIVQNGDTLQRIAVKFNCNPSDIAKENKISPFQAVIFEGQKLKIPEARKVSRQFVESSTKINLRVPLKSHPGIATRVSAPILDARSHSVDSDNDDFAERQFVKVKASRIIDCVSIPCPGTLLITPKFLVFDPERVCSEDSLNDVIQVADPISNVGVSISLDSVFSLNTYSKLSEIINERHIILEDDPNSINFDSYKFVDKEEDLYLVIKAVPLSDSYTGKSFTSATMNSLHENCKLFSFGISKERIEEVYSFLISCIGAAYNNLVANTKEPGVVQRSCEDEPMVDDGHCSVVENALKEFEQFKFKPQYKNGLSDILVDSMLEDLASSLPLNLNGCNLSLVYKTGTHGYSLGTIYRKMKTISSATLLLIRDNSNTVFGAFMSDPFHISTHYYGTGETFVFNWKPDFKKYEWTRDNSFFMKGDSNCFAIGAKSGHSAIWFEDTLKFGRSEPTDTFDNPTLCGDCEDHDRTNAETLIKSLSVDKSILTSTSLTSKGYFFVIDCLEVWRFTV